MNRRHFLVFVGASLGPFSIGCGPAPLPTWEALASRAAGCFEPSTWPQIRRVGSAALGMLDVGTEESLEEELQPTLAWLEVEGTPLDCDARVRADFRELDVRDIEGWTLSATEVHLAMLMELFDVVPP